MEYQKIMEYQCNNGISARRLDDAARRLDESSKGVIFKNCAPFTD